jgi:hypothetical protein
VFDIQVIPSDDLGQSTVIVNNVELDISRRDTLSHFLQVPDSSGLRHSVELTWIAVDESAPSSLRKEIDAIESVHFSATLHRDNVATPPSVGFTVIMRPTSQQPLVGLVSDSGSQIHDFSHMPDDSLFGPPAFENGIYDSDASSDEDDFDLGAELDSLALLENKAREIQTQIVAKKKAIAANVKHEREKLCLKHLVQECDGIICAAKAIVERLCDKVGIPTKPSFQYAHLNNKHMQHMIASDAKTDLEKAQWKQYHKEMSHHSEEANIPFMLTKNVSDFAFTPIDLVNPPNPFVRALQIIGAVLGITALFVFLKRRCMSMRRRVERAADLEERRTQRAYRRAARRALMRKRWTTFVNAINCFGRKEESRSDDYEEKRALILQDAFLEQDLDAAEKGEIMEAEIRELRNAQEIVSSLVRVDEQRYDLVVPLHDPPPPLVPLPRTPGPRSRASTYTLPSYTSETLPEYSSQPEDSDSSNSLVNGYTPSTSEEQGRQSPVSPISEASSGRPRYTPTSSIRETSTRPSGETLRTWMSVDTRD